MADNFKAMILDESGKHLRPGSLKMKKPCQDQVLVEVTTCGVCRTDLHIYDGELSSPKLPLVLGHEIIGKVVEVGEQVKRLRVGQLVGIPWLSKTCGRCRYCLSNQENLCDNAIFTGYTIDGGYAEYTVAHEDFCFTLDSKIDPIEFAPLLCAGLIGWRSMKLTGDSNKIGMYGFGAAAHLLAQVAVFQGKEIFAFTRSGDKKGQKFARDLGAVWAGDSDQLPPTPLDAAIIFAPVGNLVIPALKAVCKGGSVVCGGIHMSDIPPINYDLLWGERIIRSVANLTREDAREFLEIAPKANIKTQTTKYKLENADQALNDLRAGKFEGAAVLEIKN